MHSSRSLWVMLPPLLLLLLAAAGSTMALTAEEKRSMVELHNFYRAQVNPPASDMLQLRWDDQLADFAKAYARKCVWGHNKERGQRGENLFAITEDDGVDVPLAVANWYEEREHYNLSSGACDPGQMCGHYTQVVWSKTEKIGCGSHFCETLQGVEEANVHLLVCNYEPPGNVKGRKPYQEGTPCSQCPLGYSCANSLCEPRRKPEEAEDSPPPVTEVPSTLTTEAPSSGETGTPPLATSLVTNVAGSLAKESSPAAETDVQFSIAAGGHDSLATETQPFSVEVPSVYPAEVPSRDEGPVNFLPSTRSPVPDPMGQDASATSMSPEKSLNSKKTKKVDPLPEVLQEAAQLPTIDPVFLEAGAESKLISEALAAALPAQDGEVQASPNHSGRPASTSLPNFPRGSALANATGGRTLALRSSWTGAEDPEEAGLDLKNSGHVWGPFLGLLLPPLLMAAIF
ncbi:peptidase inhibitor 16 [Meriones unguiculatus]|uniref:peptidase inhibitor 16 n=1 Tax=Meriones unguiculatus TaxID=10047 RepID=UPI000B4F5883|nr:peptidase inhibitor 16 [Meriones unguiculatus]